MARVKTSRRGRGTRERKWKKRRTKVKRRSLTRRVGAKRGITKSTPRHRKKVRFAKYETSGDNTKFRRTKAALLPLQWSTGYRNPLLVKPCCNHMRNYQESVVEMIRCERAFLLAHVKELNKGRGRPRQATNPFAGPSNSINENTERKFLIPTNRLPDIGADVIPERNKLRGHASRKSRYHIQEGAGMDEETMVGEERPLQVFVDPTHTCPCEEDPTKCKCPICKNFL